MIEIDPLYSDIHLFNEDNPSSKEDQAAKKISDLKNSLGIHFGQEYDPLILRSLKGREIQHLQTNPLSGFKEKLAELSENVNFGVHFHGVGKGLVKGANLAFRAKSINGKEMTELDFKVNHVFRSKIQNAIDDLSQLDVEEVKTILSLLGSHGKGIFIKHNQPFPLGDTSMGSATKISVPGLGSIYIGDTPGLPTMYDRVVVHMNADKTICDLHELLAFLDLDLSLHPSEKEDIDRLKIGHLFRTFYPREALPLERSEDFFSLPVDSLKAKIIEDVPEMQDLFDTYLSQMTPEEILPGKFRYRIHGLAKKAYELGARGLTASITGAYFNQALYERLSSILKLGMLSSETRKTIGLNATGMSTYSDFYSGGADSVFTQMITKKNCDDEMNFSDLNYNSDIRLLISLDALETGTYQYFDDAYGNRKLDGYSGCDYASRPGTLEFVDGLCNNQDAYVSEGVYGYYEYSGHEVMIKERVDPSFIQKIVVSNTTIQSELIKYLETCGLVERDQNEKAWILGIPLDQFIVVANQVKDDLFAEYNTKTNMLSNFLSTLQKWTFS